jgi:anti-sigma factor RsiW
MDHDVVEHLILESFNAPLPAVEQAELLTHLANCASCAAFEARQRALDSRLSALLPPLSAPGSLRADVVARIEQDDRRDWVASLPELLHFVTCGAGTAVCAALVPLDGLTIATAGVAATLAGYALLTTARLVLGGQDA